jgi:hypothetical protein
MRFLDKHSVPRQNSIASMVLEMVFLADASLLVALFLLRSQIASVIKPFLAIILAICGFIAIYPRLLNYLISKFKRVSVRFRYNYLYMLAMLCFYVLICIISSIGFYLLCASIYHVGNIIYVMGSFMLSYFLGLVIVFAPGGLGVREGVLSIMLSAIMPMPVAIIVSFVARIWWTLAELLSIAIGWFLVRLAKD